MDERLKQITEEYVSDFSQKRDLDFVVKPSIPIIWFGDIEGYLNSSKKVITVGLNPSLNEFSESRFHIGSEDFSVEKLYCVLNDYFKVNPYRNYFNCFSKILETQIATYNFTYGKKNTAIHIDMYSSIATNPTWGKLNKFKKNSINQFGLFIKLLELLSPDVVLISLEWQQVLESFQLKQNCLILKKHSLHGPELEIYQQDKKLIVYGRNRTGKPFSVKNEIMDDVKDFFKINKVEQ